MKIINILILVFIFSCEEGAPTEAEAEALAEANDSRPRISMDMSDDYKLILGVTNFEEAVSIMSFEVIYDYKALTYSNHSDGDFGKPFANADHMDINNDSTHCSFLFTAEISGSGDLVKIDFQQNSASDLKGTTVFIRNLEFLNNGGNIIEFVDPELVVERICYIDGFESIEEGSLIWTDYGYYQWSNHFCSVNYEVLP